MLGYKPSALSFIVHKIPKEAKYTTFEIKKKSGGIRRIDAPVPMLKGLQKQLASVLYECLREIEEKGETQEQPITCVSPGAFQ